MIIFDLGGVLIKVPSRLYYRQLSKASRMPEDAVRGIIERYSLEFDSGRMTLSGFERRVGKALGIAPGSVGWLSAFESIASLDTEVAKLAVMLSRSYRISLLSNVERWRYEYSKEHMLKGIMRIFEHEFLSYKIKSVKPERAIYDYVIKKSGLRPGEILFIDDLRPNVAAARSAGMKSVQFKGMKALRLELKRFGIKTR